MNTSLRIASLIVVSAALAGCVSSGPRMGSVFGSATQPPAPVATANAIPAPNGEPIQYFAVPADGRSALLARLDTLAGGPGAYSEARISNAWRTAASAQATPNDYAACVAAVTARGPETWMVVVSGGGTGDAIGGRTGAQRCGDPTRVRSWEQVS